MLRLLVWANDWVQNYGITIILVTILIKIVLWPLTQTWDSYLTGPQSLRYFARATGWRSGHAERGDTGMGAYHGWHGGVQSALLTG